MTDKPKHVPDELLKLQARVTAHRVTHEETIRGLITLVTHVQDRQDSQNREIADLRTKLTEVNSLNYGLAQAINLILDRLDRIDAKLGDRE